MASVMAHSGEPVTDETRGAEANDARAPHHADRPPTPDEEEAAAGHEVDPSVRAHYEEMIKTGAEEEGEGRIP